MAQQNKTQLQSTINTNIADNTSGDISAADVRNSLINVSDSLLFNSGSQTFDGTLTATEFVGDGSGLTGVTGEWDGSLNGNASITGSLIATSVSSSFSGSFVGDGSGLTGVTGEWDGSLDGDAEISGSLTVSGSVVDFTDATAISGSTFSGSFVGDGSGLTGIDTDPFPYTGDVSINGNLDITGSNINFVHDTLATNVPTFTLSSTDGNPGFTIDSQTTIQQIDLHTTNDIFIEGSRGFSPTSLKLETAFSTLSGDTVKLEGASNIDLESPSITIGDDASSTTSINGDLNLSTSTEVDFTNATAISGSTFSGSFVGDGSGLTGVTSNPFPYTGTATITGKISLNDGGSSVFVGEDAGLNDDGTNNRNVGIGWNALFTNTNGSFNTATGHLSMLSNTTGANNVASGYQTLYLNTTGYSNTAVGVSSLSSNTDGYENVANGRSALGSNSSGNRNVGVGNNSLYGNLTGNENIAVGYNAGRYISNGSTSNTIPTSSVYLGTNTKANADSETNQIVIGYDTTGNGSNTVTVGNTSITDNYFNGNVTTNGLFVTNEYTVTNLPASPATGSRAHVTDATATTFYSTVTGGGSNVVPVFYNGTNWVIA